MSDVTPPSLLLRLAQEATLSLLHCSEGFEARLRPGVAMLLSGEPFADLNYLLVDDAPQVEDTFREFAAICVDRRLPFVAMLGPTVAEDLAEAATNLGLQHATALPLMVCEPADMPPTVVARVEVARVETVEDLLGSAAVLSKAFELSTDSVMRAFPIGMIESPVVDVFIARLNGQTVSSVTLTVHDDLVGIFFMGTDPAHQRRGLGRFLLTKAMDDHFKRGARRFFLGAAPAGRPLYEQIGFITQGTVQVWVSGRTSQA